MTGAQHQERQRGRGQWLLPGLLAGVLLLGLGPDGTARADGAVAATEPGWGAITLAHREALRGLYASLDSHSHRLQQLSQTLPGAAGQPPQQLPCLEQLKALATAATGPELAHCLGKVAARTEALAGALAAARDAGGLAAVRADAATVSGGVPPPTEALAGLLALATRAGRLPPPTFADGITARACARQLAGLGTAQDAATALASAEHALERALAGPAAQQR